MARKPKKSKADGAGASSVREAKRFDRAIARATAKVAKRRAQLDEASTVLADLQERVPPASAPIEATAKSVPPPAATPEAPSD